LKFWLGVERMMDRMFTNLMKLIGIIKNGFITLNNMLKHIKLNKIQENTEKISTILSNISNIVQLISTTFVEGFWTFAKSAAKFIICLNLLNLVLWIITGTLNRIGKLVDKRKNTTESDKMVALGGLL
jgi:hypothetical protein